MLSRMSSTRTKPINDAARHATKILQPRDVIAHVLHSNQTNQRCSEARNEDSLVYVATLAAADKYDNQSSTMSDANR
eukprot:CAMPEP_0172434784 /NCGR_PEP_ID=MMETSP1064-20121228/70818_1 /TAXON_ID=202472 /ORGANISM="Aulacoseira subarctica , Strain CCAP 1002/5" /LENGTH=76 /DNA_ID=CAMNT_0013183029 /DNA_START=265 /DNA_END=495 /DNA_ORIENTATION=-